MSDKVAVVPKDAVDYQSKVDLRVMELQNGRCANTGEVKRKRRNVLRKFARRTPSNRVTRMKEYLKYIDDHQVSWDNS